MNKPNIKTKKSIALISLLVALLLVSAFIIIHFVMAKNRNDELIGSEISFPESAGSFSLSNADIECDLDSLTSGVSEKKAYVYIAPDYTDYSIVEKFGFDKNDFTEKEEGRRYYKTQGRDKAKQINIDKYGVFTYETGIGRTGFEMTLTEKECVNISQNFLKEYGLWGSDMSKTCSFNETYGYTSTPNGEVEKLVGRDVNFFFEKDSIPVSGNARITVSLNGNGEVTGVIYNYREYLQKSEQPLISVEQAVNTMKTGKAYVDLDSSIGSVDITSVEISYWTDTRSDNTLIMQPVYNFIAKVKSEDNETNDLIITVQANRIE